MAEIADDLTMRALRTHALKLELDLDKALAEADEWRAAVLRISSVLGVGFERDPSAQASAQVSGDAIIAELAKRGMGK